MHRDGFKHAIHGQRPTEVDALDASVRVRATQHFAVNHVRQDQIGAEAGPPGFVLR